MARINAVLLTLVVFAYVSSDLVYAQIEQPPTIFCFDDLVYFQNVDAGTVIITDTAGGSKHIEVNGTIANDIWLMGRTSMTFNSGNARVRTRDFSILDFTGGYSEYLGIQDSSCVYIAGGEITYLTAFESSKVHFYGYDFEIIRYDVPIWGTVGPTDGLVTGFWGDGTPFSIEIGNYHSEDSIDSPITFDHLVLHEVPEPASAVLLELAGVLLRRRKI